MAKSDNGELNRSVTAANSSDPNNSLLQKVTKRVSGLIPSSFTKWFGQPGDVGSVIRRRESLDDDDIDTTQIQPPKKRAKPCTSTADEDFSATVNNFALSTSTPLISSRNDLRHLQAGPSGYTRHVSSASTSQQQFEVRNQRNEPATATITNGDDKSDSGDSTSGYSSVPAAQHKESSYNSDRVNMQAQPTTSKTSPNKSLDATFNSSRSLFSEQSLNPQRACLSARRPTFSASTFGSPSFIDRTLSTKRAVNSPFYGGRTIYGGASAYRKRSRIIFPRDETNNVAVKNSIEIKPVNTDTMTSTSSVNLGKTARRILDALEHFSSPVLDAKKIPAVTRSVGDVAKSAAAARKTPYARETRAASSKELLVPAVPDLLKMKLKSRLQDSTVQVRKVATTSTSVLNSSEYTIRTVEDTAKPQKHSSKMKTKITAVRESKSDRIDTVDAVKLPEVQLPITNLPKFDFCLPPPVSTPVKSPKPVEKLSFSVSKPTEAIKSTVKPLKPQTSTGFKFASPILVQDAPKSVATVNSYKFSEPLDAKQAQPSLAVSSTFTFKASDSSTAPRRKDSPKNNGQTSSTFSLQPPAQFVSGSVMDILGKKDNQTPVKPDTAASKPAKDAKPAGDSLMDKFKPATGTWECTACMVRNLPTATRCLACETLKEPPKKVKTQASSGFGAQFKMAADKWECSACMIRNNQADTACVACTTPRAAAAKPSAPAGATTASASLSGFGVQFKPAEGTWECASCMIRNKRDAVKCVACESPKPGAKCDKPILIMPPPAPTAGPGFGDFIKKQQQSNNWECQSCMVRNPAEKTQCMCCDTPKPGVQPETNATKSTGSQYKFGITQATTTSSSGFKFGTDKSNEPKPTTTFSFGIQPAAKPVDTSSSAATTPTPAGFTFGIPVAGATKLDEKKTEALVGVTNTVTSLPAVTKASTATITASDAPKSFTFGRPATTSQPASTANAKPTLSLSFGTNSTTTASTTTPLPTFSFTTTTTAPVITTAAVTVTKSNPVTTFSSTPGSSIFGGAVSTPATAAAVPVTTISFGAGTKTVTATTVITTAVSSSTFSFGGTSKPVTFGSENSLPQFNFGAGSLPFNPSTGTVKSGNATVPTTTVAVTASSFGGNTSAFGATNNATFTFAPAPNTTALATNKAAVKPFAFGNGDAKSTPAFSFAQKDKPAVAALDKAPVFNFGAPSATKPGDGFNATGTAPPNTSLFSFHTSKPPPPSYGAAITNTSGNVFGGPVASTPQNGGFNFGAASATPSFNFGENTGFNNPSAFGFAGQSQAGTGSTVPPAASAGVFAFGATAAAPQQQQTPAFTPDIKPNFNFTSGSVPNFTAQGPSAAPGALVQRKIRKAVRRTQPR